MFGRPTKRQRLEHPTCWLDCEALTSVPSLPQGKQQQQEAIVRNNLASKHVKDLFLDRFYNEIVQRFQFTLSSSAAAKEVLLDDDNDTYATASDATTTRRRVQQHLLKRRIRVGTNSCTRALEAAVCNSSKASAAAAATVASAAPLLIVCAAEEHVTTTAVTPVVHIPAMAAQWDVPLLLLPGRASFELGKMLRVKKVSVMTFLPATAVGTRSRHDGSAAASAAGEDVSKRDDDDDDDDDDTGGEHDHHQELKASLDRDVDSFVDFVLNKAGFKKKQG